MSVLAINSGAGRALPSPVAKRTIAQEVLERTAAIRRDRSLPQRMLDELVSEWQNRRMVTAVTYEMR